MTAPLTLLALVLVLSTVLPQVLRHPAALSLAVWAERSPRVGVFTWQALSWATISAVVLPGASLAVPSVPFTADLAVLLSACTTALRAQYATPGGAALSATGTILALGVLLRVGSCIVTGAVRTARQRRRQLRALAVTARRHEHSGALIVDHAAAAAYCLPGRGQQVVLTTAALQALDEEELAAVLAHERAHLRGRHHLVLAAAAALHQSFPRVPLFRVALREQSRLVEMLADDAATRRYPRATVATALVRLAESSAPAATMGAGGSTALARVERLLSATVPVSRLSAALVALAAVTVLVAPVLVVISPALAVANAQACLIEAPVVPLS